MIQSDTVDCRSPRYFDYAASCPPFPEALDEFARVSAVHFANPSSAHESGRVAAAHLDQTKRRFLEQCGLATGRLVLTSGGTEANNLVVRGVMERHPEGRALVAGDVHASVWFAKEIYAERVDVIPTSADGTIDPENVRRALRPETILCSVLQGSNETGVVHDVSAIGGVCAEKGVPFHCDGVQALGHIPVDVAELNCDFYTFSAHKFGGPRGVGGVLMKDAAILPTMRGGGQECGLRAGTENVAGLAGAQSALGLSVAMMDAESDRLRSLSRVLVDLLKSDVPEIVLNSDTECGLPGIVSVSAPGVLGQALATEMDLAGFAVSSGSACHSGDVEPSRVILAMGRPRSTALGTIRISMGRHTREDALRELGSALVDAIERQRALA